MKAQASSLLTTEPHEWAAKIRDKRQELGETQAQFAARFGVSQVAVSDWERSAYDPPANVTWFLYRQEQVARFRKFKGGR
jgi:DNA-binding transcriptional regulator YiaG